MKLLACTLAAVALTSLSPCRVSAADLDDDGYYDAPVAVEEQPPVVVHERIIERQYYVAPPPVAVERYPRPYPYHAGFDGCDGDYYRDRPEW